MKYSKLECEIFKEAVLTRLAQARTPELNFDTSCPLCRFHANTHAGKPNCYLCIAYGNGFGACYEFMSAKHDMFEQLVCYETFRIIINEEKRMALVAKLEKWLNVITEILSFMNDKGLTEWDD